MRKKHGGENGGKGSVLAFYLEILFSLRLFIFFRYNHILNSYTSNLVREFSPMINCLVFFLRYNFVVNLK